MKYASLVWVSPLRRAALPLSPLWVELRPSILLLYDLLSCCSTICQSCSALIYGRRRSSCGLIARVSSVVCRFTNKDSLPQAISVDTSGMAPLALCACVGCSASRLSEAWPTLGGVGFWRLRRGAPPELLFKCRKHARIWSLLYVSMLPFCYVCYWHYAGTPLGFQRASAFGLSSFRELRLPFMSWGCSWVYCH